MTGSDIPRPVSSFCTMNIIMGTRKFFGARNVCELCHTSYNCQACRCYHWLCLTHNHTGEVCQLQAPVQVWGTLTGFTECLWFSEKSARPVQENKLWKRRLHCEQICNINWHQCFVSMIKSPETGRALLSMTWVIRRKAGHTPQTTFLPWC